jgi:hypothetical protein
MDLLATLPKKRKIFIYLITAYASAVLIKLLWEQLQARLLWWPHYWGAAEVLAVIAIAFAVVQFIDAREEQHVLTSIALSMSTQFVGAFPENVPDVASVVDKAQRSVKIIVDFVGHGQYSAPQSHLLYLHAIESALARNVKVEMICYTEVRANVERLDQFGDNEFATKDNKKFEEYFRFKKMPEAGSTAELHKVLKDQNDAAMQHLSTLGLSLKYLHDPAAFFLWLSDDAEAVFAFRDFKKKAIGLSFRTKDRNLVDQFAAIFKGHWENAKDSYFWTEQADNVEAETATATAK